MQDAEDGIAAAKKMTYHELVEEMNQDIKALEQIEKPLALYKDEKAQMAEIRKEQDETLEKVKRVVYPFWSIAFVINGLLLIGYYYQEK